MSGECDYCGHHCLECGCQDWDTPIKIEKKQKRNSKNKKLNIDGLSPKERMIAVEKWEKEQLKSLEKINHPKHYKGKNFETIDIIEDFGLGFCLGNAIKYILRAGKKEDFKEDLRKAVWYINREISKQ